MQFKIVHPAIIAFSVAAMAPATTAAAEDLPVRKSGHWQLSTVSDAAGLQTIKTCLTEKDSIAAGNDVGCTKPHVQRKGDEVFVNLICQSDAGKRKVSMLLTGDFSTWYRAVTKITYDPPQNGISHLGAIVDGNTWAKLAPPMTRTAASLQNNRRPKNS